MSRNPTYLHDATASELLDELSQRLNVLPPAQAWAQPVLAAVAGHYGLELAQMRTKRRLSVLSGPRHLAVALLAQLHPTRTRSEVAAVMGLSQDMYAFAIGKTEKRIATCKAYQQEVSAILKSIP